MNVTSAFRLALRILFFVLAMVHIQAWAGLEDFELYSIESTGDTYSYSGKCRLQNGRGVEMPGEVTYLQGTSRPSERRCLATMTKQNFEKNFLICSLSAVTAVAASAHRCNFGWIGLKGDEQYNFEASSTGDGSFAQCTFLCQKRSAR